MDGKVEIIDLCLNDESLIVFVHVPIGYNITSLTLETFTTYYLGRLNSFNRIKSISHWNGKNKNLVKIFSELLELKKWDLKIFPNPVAFIALKNKPYSLR